MKNTAFMFGAFSCVAHLSVAQVPCKYEVTHVIQADFCPFGNCVFPTGISESGRYVCGYRQQCDPTWSQAFLFDTLTGQFLNLPFPPGIFTSAAADVSEDYVVGAYAGSTGPLGFLYHISTGQYTTLEADYPTGNCVATGISESGFVCGTRSIDDGGDPSIPKTGFIYDIAKQEFTDFMIPGAETSIAEDVSNNGAVTGVVRIGGVPHPYIWHNGKSQVLVVVSESSRGISDSNLIAGALATIIPRWPYQLSDAFYSDGSVINELPTLPGDNNSAAADINNDGVCIGHSLLWEKDPSIFELRGVVWQNGIVRDLNELTQFKTLFHIDRALAIAENGTIAASATVLGIKGTVVFVLVPQFVTGDVTGNCTVDVDDLLAVINDWGDKESPADLDGSGTVDLADLTIVLDSWTFE